MDKTFADAVDEIVERDPRFAKGAYYFVRMGLDHTVKKAQSDKRKRHLDQEGRPNHVSGQELLEGIRELALEQYGPMAYTLFTQWGVRDSSHFGEIVFNLVEAKILGKTERDKPEDFQEGFNFREAFVAPYLPRSQAGAAVPKKRTTRGS